VPIKWVYLKGSKELIEGRMHARQEHYMPASLLDSQFEILEEPGDDAITVDIDHPVRTVVSDILRRLNV
jgi:gluconokinase